MKRALFIAFVVFLSASVALAAPCPLAPTSLTATNLQSYSVDLYWQCPTCSPGNTPTFRIYRNAAMIGTATIVAYRDSMIIPGATYTYTITSIADGWDESAPTNVVTVTAPLVASTATPTPAFPQAFTPTPSPTPTRTPQPTSTPFAVVADPNFMNYQATNWTTTGITAWRFGSMTLNSGAAISQTVAWITGTRCYNVTVRASTPTSATMNVMVGGVSNSFVVTRTTARTFGFVTSDVYMPAPIAINNVGAGALTVHYIGMTDQTCGMSYALGAVQAASSGPLPISDFLEYFQAIPLNAPNFTLDLSSADWDGLMRIVGGLVVTLWQIGYQDIIRYYIGIRVLTIPVMWVIGFVMRRVNPNMQTTEVTILGRGTGVNVPSRSSLPKLPRSGIGRL